MRKSRWFQRYWNFKMAWFMWKENREWDYGYLIDFLIMKFTAMGLYFAKHGVVIDEDRKKQVHHCWEMRRELKHFRDAFEIHEAQYDKTFFKKFGWSYKLDMKVEDNGELFIDANWPVNYTEEQKKKVDEWKIKNGFFDGKYKLEQKALDKFAKMFVSYIQELWD